MVLTNWEVMHGDILVAHLDSNGHAKIIESDFMPYDLWLEEPEDQDDLVDTLVNNLTNFYFWCASRVLTLDRQYAKEILNSIGASQGRTDRERAQIALSYHCLTLTDIYWVREKGEDISFAKINLYENHLDNALVDVSLRGKSMTVVNAHLIADDISTSGVFPKAWIRKEDGFYLYKDGAKENVDTEILASRICRCFDCNQVSYELGEYEGTPISVSKLMTSLDHSIVTRAAFDIYAANFEFDPIEKIIALDAKGYYMMNIMDYLVGNTDRHWENWGLLMDNSTHKPIRLHDIMDFNQAFKSYDSIDGAMCQTTLPRHISQRQAAIEAVKAVGLNQIAEVDMSWFGDKLKEARMFEERLRVLRELKS